MTNAAPAVMTDVFEGFGKNSDGRLSNSDPACKEHGYGLVEL